MFVHSGAGLHGHEYSTQRPPHHTNPRSLPFLRSALRPPQETYADGSVASPRRYSSPPAPPSPLPSPSPGRQRPTSEISPRKELAVRFEEPGADMSILSEDDVSMVETEVSDETEPSLGKRRRKRVPRQSTYYALATPAPQLRTKQRRLVQIRPRILLQLQRMGDHRPTPAFDIVPSGLIGGSVIIPRLAKRCPRIFLTKPELGQDDLLIVRSEDYSSTSTDDDHHDKLDQRDVIAVVSPLPQRDDDTAEFVMEDGSLWTSSRMRSGSYEFVKQCSNGQRLIARWVQKLAPIARSNSDSGESSPPASPSPRQHKWTFSIIDPSTRRHPVMGVMKSKGLEVFENYTTLSPSSNKSPPTKPVSVDVFDEDRATKPVAEHYKQLMLATASWISLRQQGWPTAASIKARPSLQQRTSSSSHLEANINIPRSRSSSISTLAPKNPIIKRLSLPLQLPTSICNDKRESTVQEVPEDSPSPTPPQRTVSSGAAYMKRRQMEALKAQDMRSKEEEKNAIAAAAAKTREASQAEKVSTEDKTPTCRLRMRQLTHRLFHRSRNT